MNKIVIAVLVICFSFLTGHVFAQEGKNVSNVIVEDVSEASDEILVDVNAENMDEGYGSDEEYFGAEVNGIDDYINDEDLIVNAEEESIENEDDLDQVVNAVTK